MYSIMMILNELTWAVIVVIAMYLLVNGVLRTV